MWNEGKYKKTPLMEISGVEIFDQTFAWNAG